MPVLAVEGEVSKRCFHGRVWFLQCHIVRLPSYISLSPINRLQWLGYTRRGVFTRTTYIQQEERV